MVLQGAMAILTINDTIVLLFLFTFAGLPLVIDTNPAVGGIRPNAGSLEGATRLTITGKGFSKDPFSFGEGNENKGNQVLLVKSTVAVECDVLPYLTNENKIVCDTRPASSGGYSLLVFIDGVELTKRRGKYCANDKSGQKCKFRYAPDRTPTIEDIKSSRSGTPGSLVTIYGKFYIDVPHAFQRVYWGDYLCDLRVQETGEYYGVTTDGDWGSIIVKPQGTYVESQQFSLLIAGYGGTRSLATSLRVSGQNKLYHYQTHAEISGVEPSSGSMVGGTHLTVHGNYFYEDAETTVLVAGVPCDIQNISDTSIACITRGGDPDEEPRNNYPGSRGILWETWLDKPTEQGLDGDWDVNDTNITLPLRDSAVSPFAQSNSVGRLRGFFVPPRDGTYRFRIRGDYQSKLLFGSSENDTMEVCFIASKASDWSGKNHPNQTSAKLSLVGGIPYFMEARYVQGVVEVAVDMYDVNATIPGSLPEKQRITFGSIINKEIQNITIVGTYDMQSVRIQYNGCQGSDILIGMCALEDQVFQLTLNGSTTGNIQVGSSQAEVARELQRLTTVPVSVTEHREYVYNTTVMSEEDVMILIGASGVDIPDNIAGDNGRTYNRTTYNGTMYNVTALPPTQQVNTVDIQPVYNYVVVFHTRQALPLLSVSKSTELLDVEVAKITSGQEAPSSTDFNIHYGWLVSPVLLSMESSASEVERVFVDMFTATCKRIGTSKQYFYRDYEKPRVGREWGTRVYDPYCGRRSLLNPTFIFHAGKMGKKAKKYKISVYPMLCFAFKGKIDKRLYLGIEYEVSSVKTEIGYDWYNSTELANYYGYAADWAYTCVNVNTMITTQGSIKDKVYKSTPMLIISISFAEMARGDKFYVDDVSIGPARDLYRRTKAVAKPNGIGVQDVDVTKNDAGFQVTFNPADCHHDFPLIGVSHGQAVEGSPEPGSNQVIYHSPNFASGSSIAVTRIQAASLPLDGMVTLQLGDKQVTVSAETGPKTLSDTMEWDLNAGAVSVSSSGTCYSKRWDVTWTDRGSTHPLLQVNDSGLNGTEVYYSVERMQEGRALLAPIPAEFLRLPYEEPQVEVMVNHIPSVCAENASCSFTYTWDKTPTVIAITPTSGSEYDGTSVTISGSGFSLFLSENTVTIGTAMCVVTQATETAITCNVGQGHAASCLVEVNIESKGAPQYPNGNVSFEYTADITEVNPSLGSAAGGSQITISGYGFPCDDDSVDTEVMVGSRPCRVMSQCYDEIVCVIAMDSNGPLRRKRAVRTVDVMVIIDNVTIATISDAFTFDDSIAATINNINPTYSSVFGGVNLTISGTGFGSDGALVTIGNTECDVIVQSPTEVVCAIPGHKPGLYDVQVSIEDKGFADTSSISKFEYRLVVNSVSPEYVSKFGGSTVTIKGHGFGTDPSKVKIVLGDVKCEIESVRDDQIECVTDMPKRFVHVNNQGEHPVYGKGFQWNPRIVHINVGDYVYWKWYFPSHVTGVSITVFETWDEESVLYDGYSFLATPGIRGAYAYQFLRPDTYYYSSGSVWEGGDLHMKGIIKVEPKESFARELRVFVGDYEALYDKIPVTPDDPETNTSCPSMPLPQCTSANPAEFDASLFYLSFWDCATPVIKYFWPNFGYPGTVITIKGYGFGEEACQNEILIADHECVALKTNSTYIECVIDPKNTFPVGESHFQAQMKVLNRGIAHIFIRYPEGRGFMMFPDVYSSTPQVGSAEGGTRLTIIGNGFYHSWIRVPMNRQSPCVITFANYTMIRCIMQPPVGFPNIDVEVGSMRAGASCYWRKICKFFFQRYGTPNVHYVIPDKIKGPHHTIRIHGHTHNSSCPDYSKYEDIHNLQLGLEFGTQLSTSSVSIGGVDCNVTYFQYTPSDLIECTVSYVPVGKAEIVLYINPQGWSDFINGTNSYIWVDMEIESVTPRFGSALGEQLITIVGCTFHINDTKVFLTGEICKIQSINATHITCITPRFGGYSRSSRIVSGDYTYNGLQFRYSSEYTPEITDVTPSSGRIGVNITITGKAFSDVPAENIVTIGGALCDVITSSADTIICSVGHNTGGLYHVLLHVQGKGRGYSSPKFKYLLGITNISLPNQGSFGGGSSGRTLNISGFGFADKDRTTVTLCGNKCIILDISISWIECDVPGNPDPSDTHWCDITVKSAGAKVTQSNAWLYRRDFTPVVYSVYPPRGGTGGGTTMTITGTGFHETGNKVTIAGTECTIKSESVTDIVCRTGARSRSLKTKVRVYVSGKGVAKQDNASYHYVDVWSSRYTWGGQDPPIEGDFVIIPEGQLLLLDTDTPKLKMLLIKGGSLIFDEVDITLNAEYILITNDGLLQIGTEKEPFQHKATIVLHGHVRSKALPLYGAKVLAVRNGTLELHGKPIPVTWTHLAATIKRGDKNMTLMKPVTWNVGDEIVIASTGDKHSMEKNEKRTITGVSDDGYTLTVEPPLRYTHLSMVQTIGNFTYAVRGEVGLLTRNVVVRGSVHAEWTQKIKSCKKRYNANQFATLTCFQGRFGQETASDQFGVHIMLFAKRPHQHWATGRLEYVEVTHAGQAFRLGRYPIHFHLNGDSMGNYVRGCSIHNAFNRAVAITAVHQLVVEHNVVYNVMGHAFLLENGLERKNTIQYNLAVFVKPSSSMMNSDNTPAAFWIQNPDNYVSHNAAAGGSHHGFWYNLQSEWRTLPLLGFYNNTCHTHGLNGLWIHPRYFPTEIAEFRNFTAWSVAVGAEGGTMGMFRFINFLVSDAELSGISVHTSLGFWGVPMLKNAVIIGRSRLSRPYACTDVGLQLPRTRCFTVDGIKFINFRQTRLCTAIMSCALCESKQGGFHTRFKNVEFYRVRTRTRWDWAHQWWYEDVDGSLTGKGPGYSILPQNPNLPPEHCTFDSTGKYGGAIVQGAVCDETVKFHRFAFNEPTPKSLEYKSVSFTNQHGRSVISYKRERLTHKPGWMVTLIAGETYKFKFEDQILPSRLEYKGRVDDFTEGDFVILQHTLTQSFDGVQVVVGGGVKRSSEQPLTYHGNQPGDWYLEDKWKSPKVMTYLVSGKGLQNQITDVNIHFKQYLCHFGNCTNGKPPTKPPPTKMPPPIIKKKRTSFNWSDPEAWKETPAGYGGNYGNGEYGLPRDGDNVLIQKDTHIFADTDFPRMFKLLIRGTLELLDTQDFNLHATYILIVGGRLMIGTNETHGFQHQVRIILEGDNLQKELRYPRGIPHAPDVIVSSRTLAAFGGLFLYGKKRTPTWTHLATTAHRGDNNITVTDDTDWQVGDEIVVVTTSYETRQTEIFRIKDVVNMTTFILNAPFEHKHLGEEYTAVDGSASRTYSMRAEVGLFTRNIKIKGSYDQKLFRKGYGGRVIVGRLLRKTGNYRGSAKLSNVEFVNTGQGHFTDQEDPRFSMAFLDACNVQKWHFKSDRKHDCFVKGCSFHDGFNTAIGFFETNKTDVMDNVIHRAMGSGIFDKGKRNKWIRNLVSGTVTPLSRTRHTEFIGGIDLEYADSPTLFNNSVAGSHRAGYKVKGQGCRVKDKNIWHGNVAHGTLHGVFMLKKSTQSCTLINGFMLYRNWYFGIYIQEKSSLIISDFILVDNRAAVVPLVIGGSPLLHEKTNKFVSIENTLIVSMSPGYNCEDGIRPKSALGATTWMGPLASSSHFTSKGGYVGLLWPSFMSGSNDAPKYPIYEVIQYPSLSGRTLINNVMFSGFEERCGYRNVAIMTNPHSPDFMHPIYMQNTQLERVDEESKLLIHRPYGRWVNPSDCVDMDCDGPKKMLLKDLDGSFLGSVGTVIPDSAFEWGGDRSRGLGYYRVPKVMVTEVDGKRIPYKKKMPNKGIYRGHKNNCIWKPSWTAYKCRINYNVLLIESLDEDTEVRRISPVGLYTDTYIDLINGPQDHGKCGGYACQERISTFFSIVALGMEYELVFTGTNPYNMQLQMINANADDRVVVGTWYASPQRLDVYYGGLYITPNNGDYDHHGEFVWKNDKSPDQYKPSVHSNKYGENFFDRATQYLYVLIHGPRSIIIRTVPVIMVTFGVPSVPVDEFYEVNLISNLVAFLDVEPAQIRIVNIVAEDSMRRRRRRSSGGGAEVVIEIGDPPVATIETPDDTPSVANATSNTTTGLNDTGTYTSTATPTSNDIPDNTSHDHADHSLSFDSLLSLQSTIANEMQQGSLADSLEIEIVAMAMTDPVPEPVDPTGGVRASNQTGGSANGTERYDEHLAHLEAESESAESASVVYRIPKELVVKVQPGGSMEEEPFAIQPKINVLDATGMLVEHLGTRANPWLLTASIRPGSSSHDVSIHGNLTLPFTHGWVNFTGLTIDASTTNVVLDFHITYPTTSKLAVSSVAFNTAPRPYSVGIVDAPAHYGDMHVGEHFSVIIEIRDGITGQTAEGLDGKRFLWYASASLYMPTNYRGRLLGETNVTFDLYTAQAQFNHLTISAPGYHYIIKMHVNTSPPSNYDYVFLLDPFDVVNAGHELWNASRATFTIRFDADYDTVVAGKQELLKINFLNTIGPMYPNVTMSNVNITRGSILISFDMQGEDLISVRDQLWEDLSDGSITLHFNGFTLTADAFLMIGGFEYVPPDDDYEEEEEEYEEEEEEEEEKDVTPYMPEVIPNYQSLLPVWTVAVLVANGIIFIFILVWCCYMCECKSSGDDYTILHFGPRSNVEKCQEDVQEYTTIAKEESNVDNISNVREATPTPSLSNIKTTPTAAVADATPIVTETKPTADVTDLTSMGSETASHLQEPEVIKPNTTVEAESGAATPNLEQENVKEMFVIAKNNHGVFSKIASVNVNYKGSVYDLHQTVTRALTDQLKGRDFDLLTETLEKVDVSREEQLTVAQVYSSDCVLIRMDSEETVAHMLCPCGKAGMFTCESCGDQAYCSQMCQTRDWPRHTNVCSKFK